MHLTTKNDFIRNLPNMYNITMERPRGHDQSTDTNKIVNEVARFLNKKSFLSILQGYMNIGIDENLNIRAKYKLLGMVYSSDFHVDIVFPLSIKEIQIIKWFFKNATELLSSEEFAIWAQRFENKHSKAGKKRKLNTDEDGDITWLLDDSQEKKLMNIEKYFRSDFADEETLFVNSIQNGFASKSMSHDITSQPVYNPMKTLDSFDLDTLLSNY